MRKWAKWQLQGMAIAVLGVVIYLAGLAIGTSGPVYEVPVYRPEVAFALIGMTPVGVFMMIAGTASYYYYGGKIKRHRRREAERAYDQRTPAWLLVGGGPPIKTDGLLSLYGDFNFIHGGDYDYVLVCPSDLERFRKQIRPGLRVHLSDGDFESEGIVQLVDGEWRGRILWETSRDIEDEEQDV